MGQNKNFIAARLPQELYDRLKSVTDNKPGEKTRIIIAAIAAYLDFPVKSTNTAADSSERFIALENRIAELEQQFQEFRELVISGNHTDNKFLTPLIVTDGGISSSDNSTEPSIAVDNKDDNKSRIPIQSDGTIGPAPESHIADFIGISRNTLGYHRKNLEKIGKPLNNPKRIEYNSKPYDLICLGESKTLGKTKILWTAKPVIKLDNNVYQPDIIEYQPDNNLTETTQVFNQEEQKQELEILKLSDNKNYQVLSEELNTNQESNELNSQPLDNTSYQTLSAESNINQEEQEQNKHHLENLSSTDNSSYQSLSTQPDFNEELNEQQQDSGKQAAEHQPELPGEEQPEF